ncbi:hypothetical protein [Agreia bicolorata]|uniref:hypothetical protein n=1 Tax=Agreia bicolorata TaxID=110935 RepID=UPI000B0440D7|nr:hypothetical protein [Agreia bicolorata]
MGRIVTEPALADLLLPTLLPHSPAGHVRMRADALPTNVFGSNVRGIARESEWDRIRLAVSARAGKRCEICGGESLGPKRRVQHPDCHEIWRFELRESEVVQVLAGLIALCKKCHNTQHVGRALDLKDVKEVLAEVNGWNYAEAHDDVRRAFARSAHLKDYPINLDLSLLRGQILVPGSSDLKFTAEERTALGNSWTRAKPPPQMTELDFDLS